MKVLNMTERVHHCPNIIIEEIEKKGEEKSKVKSTKDLQPFYLNDERRKNIEDGMNE